MRYIGENMRWKKYEIGENMRWKKYEIGEI